MYFVCDVNFGLASGPVEYMGQVGFLTVPYSSVLNRRPCTGCGSHFRNPAPFNIQKKPFLVLKQKIHQQKALYLSFKLTP